MQIENKKHDYFCVYCAEEKEVEMPEYWEPSPFLRGQECEECGKKTLAYQPPATYYND